MNADELEAAAEQGARAASLLAAGAGVIVLLHDQGTGHFALGSDIHSPGVIEALLRAALRQFGGRE